MIIRPILVLLLIFNVSLYAQKPLVQNGKKASEKQQAKQVTNPSHSPSAGTAGNTENSTLTKETAGTQTNFDDRIYRVKVIPEPHDGWYVASVIVSMILAFIGVVTLFLLWRQTRATEISAIAAFDNAKAIINSERAWIVVSPAVKNPDILYSGTITRQPNEKQDGSVDY